MPPRVAETVAVAVAGATMPPRGAETAAAVVAAEEGATMPRSRVVALEEAAGGTTPRKAPARAAQREEQRAAASAVALRTFQSRLRGTNGNRGSRKAGRLVPRLRRQSTW